VSVLKDFYSRGLVASMAHARQPMFLGLGAVRGRSQVVFADGAKLTVSIPPDDSSSLRRISSKRYCSAQSGLDAIAMSKLA
jgi:hypothetical protein